MQVNTFYAYLSIACVSALLVWLVLSKQVLANLRRRRGVLRRTFFSLLNLAIGLAMLVAAGSFQLVDLDHTGSLIFPLALISSGLFTVMGFSLLTVWNIGTALFHSRAMSKDE